MPATKKNILIKVQPDIHKIIKTHTVENDTTIQDYMYELILQDLQKKYRVRKH